MRKRLVIGAVVGVIIGLATYLSSQRAQPEKGSVEWHKIGYLKERRKVEGRTVLDQLERLYVKVRKPRNYRFRSVSNDELQKHTDALIRLGFLEAKTITVWNPMARSLESLLTDGHAVVPEERQPFTHLSATAGLTFPSQVYVLAPREDIALWERLIRSADASVPPPAAGQRSLKLLAPDKAPKAAGLDEVFQEKGPPY